MKQRITVTIDSDSYQLLKSADVNISALVNRAMQNEARRLRSERWQAENQEGMAEVARFIDERFIRRRKQGLVRCSLRFMPIKREPLSSVRGCAE
jgi:antitoxin CcdA